MKLSVMTRLALIAIFQIFLLTLMRLVVAQQITRKIIPQATQLIQVKMIKKMKLRMKKELLKIFCMILILTNF